MLKQNVQATFTNLNCDFSPSEEQIEAMKGCVERVHQFVTLPTGYGKSFIFLALPKLLELMGKTDHALVVVVCPLLSLMRSHVEQAGRHNVSAVLLETEQDLKAISQWKQGIVMASPERWLGDLGRRFFRQLGTRVHTVFLDEVHVMPKWCVQLF